MAVTIFDVIEGLQEIANYDTPVNERISKEVSKNMGGPAKFSVSINVTDSAA